MSPFSEAQVFSSSGPSTNSSQLRCSSFVSLPLDSIQLSLRNRYAKVPFMTQLHFVRWVHYFVGTNVPPPLASELKKKVKTSLEKKRVTRHLFTFSGPLSKILGPILWNYFLNKKWTLVLTNFKTNFAKKIFKWDLKINLKTCFNIWIQK